MRILLAALLLTLAVAAGAEEPGTGMEATDGSPLQLLRIGRQNELIADFSGTVEITGTLLAEYPSSEDGTWYAEPTVTLVPDAASIARLPHFTHYPVRQLELRNARHALYLAAGKARAIELLDHEVQRLEITGTFAIGDYTVGVECDAAYASATVVSATASEPASGAPVARVESC